MDLLFVFQFSLDELLLEGFEIVLNTLLVLGLVVIVVQLGEYGLF